MALLHFRSIERRRTARVALSVDLIVHGLDVMDQEFTLKTRTMSVSGHGGLMALDAVVVLGQTLGLLNDNNRKKAECRIVSIRRSRDGKVSVAFEFVGPQKNFWDIAFPATGAKALKRPVASTVGI
jgi:hypothetical protein